MLKADFSNLDSVYEGSGEPAERISDEELVYAVSYTISLLNTRPAETYAVPITAIDRAGNVSIMETSLVYDPAYA